MNYGDIRFKGRGREVGDYTRSGSFAAAQIFSPLWVLEIPGLFSSPYYTDIDYP